MKRFIKTAIAAAFCAVFASCSKDDGFDPIAQQEAFQNFLSGKNISYDQELARQYIYKVALPDTEYLFEDPFPAGDRVLAGDVISIYYVIYGFNGGSTDGYGREEVYATNIPGVAVSMGADIPPEGVSPYKELTFTLGDKDVLKGLNQGIPGSSVGDAFLLYLSADFVYNGDDQVGYIPPEVPVVFEIYITKKSE